MFKLIGNARTILKSRMRSHPRRVQVIGTDPALITDAKSADLEQWAMLLQLDAPTQDEVQNYDEKRVANFSSKMAIEAVNIEAASNGQGGLGLLEIVGRDTPNQIEASGAATPAPAPAPAPAADGQKEKAEKEVKAALALFGSGDMSGFNNALHNIAMRANRPEPKPVAQQVARVLDATKISGQVPKQIARLDLAAAGITGKFSQTRKTSFAKYDAIDAPAIDPAYIWPKQTTNALIALDAGQNIFLSGPAGTGKTSFAKQLAARFGRPFVRISCNDRTDAPTLVGQPSLENGSTGWEDGQLVKAIRKPSTVVLIDEPSAAMAGAMMILQGVLDDDRCIQIAETGETVHVAPDVVFILADNTAGYGDENGLYEGTRVMNKATLDRMALTIPMAYLSVGQETKAIVARSGICSGDAANIANFAKLTRNKSAAGDLSHGLGIRRLIALATQIAAGADVNEAFQMCCILAAPYDDREALRQLWEAEITSNTFKGEKA